MGRQTRRRAASGKDDRINSVKEHDTSAPLAGPPDNTFSWARMRCRPGRGKGPLWLGGSEPTAPGGKAGCCRCASTLRAVATCCECGASAEAARVSSLAHEGVATSTDRECDADPTDLEIHHYTRFSAHAVLRWPLFFVLCLIFSATMVLYLATRALVSCLEWLFATHAVRSLKRRMAGASSYEEWRAAAEELDRVTGRNAWKAALQSRYYAYKFVAAATAELRTALDKRDHALLLRTLQQLLRDTNFAGHLSEDLYSMSFSGTKWHIDEYCNALCEALRFLREEVGQIALEVDRPTLTRPGESSSTEEEPEEEEEGQGPSQFNLDPVKRSEYEQLLFEVQRFSEFAVCTFGRSALCLSGGGAIALQHFGVVAELLKRGLLPKVISGTSGGAVVACYVCCRTDEELRGEVQEGRYPLRLDPEHIRSSIPWPFHGNLTERMKRYYQHGCLFSTAVWEECAKPWALGDTTFLEAYLRTGRVLNVTASMKGADGGQQSPVLLNYQTHPHVLVRSAFVCSAAMPNLALPQQLLEKCPKTGEIRLHSEERFYADGSIDYDIPVHTLAQTFGIRYTIASQVNPHVTPFLFAAHGEAGSPIHWRGGRGRWRGGFILSAAEVMLKELIRGVWRLMATLELLPQAFGTCWDLMFTQNFEGSVTLSNNNSYFWKAAHALENPTEDAMEFWWVEGQRMLWKKMALLEKRLQPEAELFQLEAAIEAAMHGGAKGRISPTGLSVRRSRSRLHLPPEF